jgi:hypothetical protein
LLPLLLLVVPRALLRVLQRILLLLIALDAAAVADAACGWWLCSCGRCQCSVHVLLLLGGPCTLVTHI